VETQAHQFAAAFLMPSEDIYDRLPSKVDWQVLFELKRHWQVSLAALLMRAKTLGKMTDRTYLTAVKTISARGWRGGVEEAVVLAGGLETFSELLVVDFELAVRCRSVWLSGASRRPGTAESHTYAAE
jgi:Zn-dependent peptidase ImmA (M78 family)